MNKNIHLNIHLLKLFFIQVRQQPLISQKYWIKIRSRYKSTETCNIPTARHIIIQKSNIFCQNLPLEQMNPECIKHFSRPILCTWFICSFSYCLQRVIWDNKWYEASEKVFCYENNRNLWVIHTQIETKVKLQCNIIIYYSYSTCTVSPLTYPKKFPLINITEWTV